MDCHKIPEEMMALESTFVNDVFTKEVLSAKHSGIAQSQNKGHLRKVVGLVTSMSSQ